MVAVFVGSKLYNAGGNNVYKVAIPSDATMIIFNSNGQQTDDIALEGVNKLYDTGKWWDYTG